MGAIAQAEADAWWAGMFPFTFDTLIPPPGGVSEVTAIAGSPTALGSITGAYDTWEEDAFANTIASAVHTGASAIQVTVNYITPPSSPAVLVGGVS